MTKKQLEERVAELEATLEILIEDAGFGDCPLASVDVDDEMASWCEMVDEEQYAETCKRDRDSSVCTVLDCWMHYAEVRMAGEAQ